jgi:hypothetical protein
MTKDEALRLALEALETPWNAPYVDGCDLALGKKVKAITAIKEALANEALDKMAENARELGLDYEPAQEPVSQPKVRTGNCLRVGVCASEGHKIQPQRTWVGLTDEEILTYRHMIDWTAEWSYINFARAIEAAHGIKGQA